MVGRFPIKEPWTENLSVTTMNLSCVTLNLRLQQSHEQVCSYAINNTKNCRFV